jgi:NTE family protein
MCRASVRSGFRTTLAELFRPSTAWASFCLALGLATSACASFHVADTRQLPQSKLEPLGADRISKGGYRIDSLPVSADAPDLLVLVAMSGGGKRSASFGYGALKGMRDLMVPTRVGPRPLLEEVDAISGVSGGSFPAAYYGLYRQKMFGQFEKDFLYDDTNSYIFGIYLLPWNWAWLVRPGIGTNDFMDRLYDRTMFHGATYTDLQNGGRPLIAIGATDISYGTPVLFTQETFDLICSDLSTFPISRAIAASNGFPGLFSPITLTNHAKACGGREPGWLRRISPDTLKDPLSRMGQQALRAKWYLDADQTRYLHLADGGVSDNLAMRSAGSMMQALSTADLRERGYLQVRRLLVISIDGQGTQDSSVARRRDVGGLFAMLGLVSGGQIDSYNFETLTVVNQQVQIVTRRLRDARCAQGRIVNGTRCDDVDSELLHISLAGLPETPQKERLLAIPTGLTLKREDVDALMQAGYDGITKSPELRAFLENYPPVPPQASVRAPARTTAAFAAVLR